MFFDGRHRSLRENESKRAIAGAARMGISRLCIGSDLELANLYDSPLIAQLHVGRKKVFSFVKKTDMMFFQQKAERASLPSDSDSVSRLVEPSSTRWSLDDGEGPGG